MVDSAIDGSILNPLFQRLTLLTGQIGRAHV